MKACSLVIPVSRHVTSLGRGQGWIAEPRAVRGIAKGMTQDNTISFLYNMAYEKVKIRIKNLSCSKWGDRVTCKAKIWVIRIIRESRCGAGECVVGTSALICNVLGTSLS
jgi:hypothetical protein